MDSHGADFGIDDPDHPDATPQVIVDLTKHFTGPVIRRENLDSDQLELFIFLFGLMDPIAELLRRHQLFRRSCCSHRSSSNTLIRNGICGILISRSFSCQSDCAVYHHFLTKRSRHDVRQTRERLENTLGNQTAQWIEQ
jgi:hypothetical protein